MVKKRNSVFEKFFQFQYIKGMIALVIAIIIFVIVVVQSLFS
jgi:hypothetical protein